MALNRPDAISRLRSTDHKQRLAAARFFVRECLPEDVPLLKEVLAVENVYWVRAALQAALRNQGALDEDMDESFKNEAGLRVRIEDLAPQVVNSAARLVLHELRASIGRVDAYASVEVPSFPASSTGRELSLLRMKLEAIDRLGQASTPPVISEVDLALLLSELAHSSEIPQVEVLIQGTKPNVILSDASLISLIVSNGLRNAVEASAGVQGRHDRGRVVMSWGATAEEHYVRIIDDGKGLDRPFLELVKWGKSTRGPGHGYGLAIAFAAAKSLNGVVTVENLRNGGARFDFRWRAGGFRNAAVTD